MPYDWTNDGRQVWVVLLARYEGEGFRNRSVDDTYSTL